MLENEVKELTAAVQENTATMREMIKGRDEALAALQEQAKNGGGAAATTTRKARGTKAAETPAAAASGGPSWKPDLSVEGMRAIAAPYLSVENPEQKAINASNVKAVLQHLGADVLNPLEAKPDAKAVEGDDDRRKAAFYITRFREGLTVNFSAEYDFDSDPCSQGELEPAPEPAAPADDDLLG